MQFSKIAVALTFAASSMAATLVPRWDTSVCSAYPSAYCKNGDAFTILSSATQDCASANVFCCSAPTAGISVLNCVNALNNDPITITL